MRKDISALARVQHGLVSIDQLEELDVPRGFVYRRLTSGEWRRLGPRVVGVNGAPETVLQRCAAALLSRDAALLSGRTAAWLHAFDGSRPPTRPEITVPFSASARCVFATVRRSQHFANIATVTVDGLAVATVAETIFRMAAYVGPLRLTRFIDDALLRDRATTDELGEIYLRHQGERMRGMARLRPILLERLSTEHVPTESELEALADEVLSGMDIPAVIKQAPIPWATSSGRVDRLIPAWKLIIELDGRAWHTRTEAFELDRERDNAALRHGYTTLRLTWRMLADRPAYCRGLVLDIGRQRSSSVLGTSITR